MKNTVKLLTFALLVSIVPAPMRAMEMNDPILQNLNDHNRFRLLVLRALKDGDLAPLRKALEEGADANIFVNDGYRTSLLSVAIANKNIDLVSLLLEFGANANGLDGEKKLPLTFAMCSKNTEIQELLIKHGADKEAAVRQFEIILNAALKKIDLHSQDDQFKPMSFVGTLSLAIVNKDMEPLKELFQAGQDINQVMQMEFGNYPPLLMALMFQAATGKNIELVKLLLEHGADPNYVAPNGETSLVIAILMGADDIVELLIKHKAQVNSIGQNIRCPLLVAIDRDCTNIARLLIEAGADIEAQNQNGTALYQAIDRMNIEIVRLLLARGAKIKNDGPQPDLTVTAIPEIAAELIKYGADVNGRNENEDTALILACLNNLPELIGELCKHGADVNLAGAHGETTLMHAVANPEMCTMILAQKPNLEAIDEEGATALHRAIGVYRNPDVVKLLIQAGVHVQAQANKGATPLQLICINPIESCYFDMIEDQPQEDDQEQAPGDQQKIINENLCIAQMLLDCGAQVDDAGNTGTTPLMYVCGSMQSELIEDEELPAGMDQHQMMNKIFTDLNVIPYIRFLLDHGANRDLKNKEGQTARECAMLRGREDIVELLDTHRPWGGADLKLRAARALLVKCATLDVDGAKALINSIPEDLREAVVLIAPNVVKDKICTISAHANSNNK